MGHGLLHGIIDVLHEDCELNIPVRRTHPLSLCSGDSGKKNDVLLPQFTSGLDDDDDDASIFQHFRV